MLFYIQKGKIQCMNELINKVLSHLEDLNKILGKEVITRELLIHNYRYNVSDLNTDDPNLFLVSLIKVKENNKIKEINVGENLDKINIVLFLNMILDELSLEQIEVND